MSAERAHDDTGLLLRDHLGLVVTAVVFFSITWRILVLARFNGTTALGIVQLGGATDIAVAGALASVPVVAGTLYLLGLMWLGLRVKDPDTPLTFKFDPWFYILAPLIMLALFFLPLSFLAAGPLWLLRSYGLRWWRVHRGSTEESSTSRSAPLSRTQTRLWAGSAVLVAVLGSASQSWLPTEHFTPRSGEPITGYAIAREGKSIVIVTRGRPVRLLRVSASGLRREFCEPSLSWWEIGLPDLGQDSRYEDCPGE